MLTSSAGRRVAAPGRCTSPGIARALAALAVLVAARAAPARAQAVDRRYVAEPSQGVALPATPLAGEHDARALSANPAGLQFLRGPEAILALDWADPDTADATGTGGGLFLAGPWGGSLVPRLGLGVGLEVLRPARENLRPDPGTPLRASLGASLWLTEGLALGVAWRHFFDDLGVDGLDVLDLGASMRLGNRAALGAVVRDLNGPRAQGAPVQRRYEAEVTLRPTGTDRLELGLGGRVGERRGNLDGWGRASLRLGRGFYAHLGVETRELRIQTTTGAESAERDGRDVRATLGLELSFGGLGVTTYASALRDDRGGRHLAGGGLVLRSSLVGAPSILGREDHLERVELSGALGGPALVALVSRLRAIGRDRSARAVALVFDDLTAGWAALREVRRELAALRAGGKRIFAFLGGADTREYYLASVADRVYLDPAGELTLLGVATTTMYWRGALDLVGVTPEFEKIAEYKSAPEQFTRTGPSVPAARMRAELLDGLWAEVVSAIAADRKLGEDEVRRLVDQGPYSAGDLATDQRLIDAIATPERAAALIAQELGAFYPVTSPPVERPSAWSAPAVAIIHVQGDIVDGRSRTVPLLGRRMAGGETIAGAIAAARADPSIGAIVLRIDSPGGSALASELIAREVFATRGHKPILCSMSNVAASGGYLAAAGCELIFAESTTITGSIGIFFGKFDLSGLLRRAGVSVERATRGLRADLGTSTRPYTDEERALLRTKILYTYGRFVGAVAEGRGMSRQAVDDVGRGRVWTGERARALGLVDRLGGIGDALDEVRRRLHLGPDDRLALVQLPRVDGGLLATLRQLTGAEASAAEGGALAAAGLDALLEGVWPSVLVAPTTAQARLPFDVSW